MALRPDRLLVAAPLQQDRLHAWERWVAALSAQSASLWDVLLVDTTERPWPGYVAWLNGQVRARPFGPRHRVRVLRAGRDEGLGYPAAAQRRQRAQLVAIERFRRWLSYDMLVLWEPDVIAGAPDDLSSLTAGVRGWREAAVAVRRSPASHDHVPLPSPHLRLTALDRELVEAVDFMPTHRGVDVDMWRQAREADQPWEWCPVQAQLVAEWELL